ncbi:MAG: 3-deoxy-7-phosphoheptulonate synthase, partial [Deltaproteobacteria bacterium]|nr:3-deoxy-7-phosphoheptulonate synthase [Deltaproteobacteria bacterium]
MIIVMKKDSTPDELKEVVRRITELGYHPHIIHGETRNVIGAVGDERGKKVLQSLDSLPGVENVVPILKPYKLASREVSPLPSAIDVGLGVRVGGPKLVVMAGPCAVESREQ